MKGCHGSFIAHDFFKARPFTLGKTQAQAHGIRHGENVRKQNGSIKCISVQGLQRDFGGEIFVCCQAHEAAGFFTSGSVLWQITAGLPHEPNWGVISCLPETSPQKTVIL